MVQYIANLTNHKFVRINNHEHTDIQEYMGTYGNVHKFEYVYVYAYVFMYASMFLSFCIHSSYKNCTIKLN